MQHSVYYARGPRSWRPSPCKSALERIDAYLRRSSPEIEKAKLEKALLVMFGPRPERFVVDDPSQGKD